MESSRARSVTCVLSPRAGVEHDQEAGGVRSTGPQPGRQVVVAARSTAYTQHVGAAGAVRTAYGGETTREKAVQVWSWKTLRGCVSGDGSIRYLSMLDSSDSLLLWSGLFNCRHKKVNHSPKQGDEQPEQPSI